jgi:hypothetical protein
MSRESQTSSLATVALLIGVLAGLTTILGYLGWRPRWEQTTGSAEPTKTEPATIRAASEPVKAPAAVPDPPKGRAVPEPVKPKAAVPEPAKERAASEPVKAEGAAPERAKERAVPESGAAIPPAGGAKEGADQAKENPRPGSKHRRHP